MRTLVFARVLVAALTALPISAIACACCGVDHWWSANDRKIVGYDASMLSGLTMLKGEFNDSPGDAHDYPISRIDRAAGVITFQTKQGPFLFRFGNTFEHQASDITFITQPHYKLDNVADIYHELILRGKIQLPANVLTPKSKRPVAATLIFQGLGGSCVGAELFGKWVLRIEGTNLKAWGKVKGKQANI